MAVIIFTSYSAAVFLGTYALVFFKALAEIISVGKAQLLGNLVQLHSVDQGLGSVYSQTVAILNDGIPEMLFKNTVGIVKIYKQGFLQVVTAEIFFVVLGNIR